MPAPYVTVCQIWLMHYKHTHIALPLRNCMYLKMDCAHLHIWQRISYSTLGFPFNELNLFKHFVHWGKMRYFGTVLNSWTHWLEYSTSVFPWQQSACAISCTTKGWKSRHSNLKPFPCKQILSLGFTFQFSHLISSSTFCSRCTFKAWFTWYFKCKLKQDLI